MQARNIKKTTEPAKEKPMPITVSSFNVNRVYPREDGSVFADITINGITVYGCSVRAGKNDEAFLAWPSSKGKDGKYYKQAWAPLAQEDMDSIIMAIYNKVDGKD